MNDQIGARHRHIESRQARIAQLVLQLQGQIGQVVGTEIGDRIVLPVDLCIEAKGCRSRGRETQSADADLADGRQRHRGDVAVERVGDFQILAIVGQLHRQPNGLQTRIQRRLQGAHACGGSRRNDGIDSVTIHQRLEIKADVVARRHQAQTVEADRALRGCIELRQSHAIERQRSGWNVLLPCQTAGQHLSWHGRCANRDTIFVKDGAVLHPSFGAIKHVNAAIRFGACLVQVLTAVSCIGRKAIGCGHHLQLLGLRQRLPQHLTSIFGEDLQLLSWHRRIQIKHRTHTCRQSAHRRVVRGATDIESHCRAWVGVVHQVGVAQRCFRCGAAVAHRSRGCA